MNFRKIALGALGIFLAAQLAVPQKASAQVNIGVTIGRPAPVVVAPAPVIVAPPPPVAYTDAYIAAHNWTFGFHQGWYYDGGTRYWIDGYRHRHYDDRYRDARVSWMRHHRRWERERDHRGWERDHYHRDHGRWHDGGHYDRGRGHGHGRWHGDDD